jgi:putative DNA primase/helicase
MHAAPANLLGNLASLGDDRVVDPLVDDMLDVGGTAKNPVPLGSPLNVQRIMVHDPRWAGKLCYDQFADVVRFDGQALRDQDATTAALWLDEVYQVRCEFSKVHTIMDQVARASPVHPVRSYLQDLQWDGRPRLSTWITRYLEVKDTPLHRAIGTKFMLSAVARVFIPGCKVDTTLVLAGKQGAGKSRAAQILASEPWFNDSQIDIGNKDAFQQIHGSWIYEVAELNAFRGREATAIKAFLSSGTDRYRPPFGRSRVDVPRQNVFICTTNEDDFLEDATGHRRFWVVLVGGLDQEALIADRDQLWAEAVELYTDGKPWHLDREEGAALAAANKAFEAVDAWEETVLEWVNGRRTTSAMEIATEALRILPREMDRSTDMRITKILKRAGWVRNLSHRPVRWHMPS